MLRESVSNVVRHAHATTLSVELRIRDDVSVEITDNGRGISDADTRRSGLDNLAARAEDAGGHFETQPNPTGGTILRWSAPLP